LFTAGDLKSIVNIDRHAPFRVVVLPMPRQRRKIAAGVICDVLNRGNGPRMLFAKESDLAAFASLLAEALQRFPVDLPAYCVTGNHWHLILRPRTNDDGVDDRYACPAAPQALSESRQRASVPRAIQKFPGRVPQLSHETSMVQLRHFALIECRAPCPC
jgi:hypothetical protein